ncbi:hypothetical protein BWQ96_04575 [Gracilariopsis chorda]|uniref:Uncharacterized protein n=1 Tax=Gracilariopsis chorda TaxID=448386 RepID=A0A2V3IU86_9FLOR|nr:hypothetical protein BWQ96_04575 [Gracilariopsis chorda]|eukprot:PXF45671.1 hypothetical protein BWQ96_04575 [Gracilariopsis chorda]
MRCFGAPFDPHSTPDSSNTSASRRTRLFRRFLRSPLLRSEVSTLSELRFSPGTSKLSPNSSRYSADRLLSSSSCSKSTSPSPTKPPASAALSIDSDHFARSLSYNLDPALQHHNTGHDDKYNVRRRVAQYDQRHIKSTLGPPLVEVKTPRLEKDSVIYRRVQSFESLERHSRRRFGPSLSELRHLRNKNGFVLVDTNGPYAEYTL